MKYQAFRRALLSLAAIASLLVVLSLGRTPDEGTVTATMLQADGQLRWYRGNIHTHSLWSDGDDYPEMIALWYREQGYDFLSLSDHNILSNFERWTNPAKNKGGATAYDKLKKQFPDNWVEERTVDDHTEVRLKTFQEISELLNIPGRFLMVQGEEITDRFKNLPVHMNATNIQEQIPPLGGDSVYETMQNNVNAVIAQSERTGQPILIHLNHPNYGYGVTAEDLMRVHGENFFEIHNGAPAVANYGDETHLGTEQMWDIILAKRLMELHMPVMYGVAADDAHNYHQDAARNANPGRGWIMVLADKLVPESLIAAMNAGRFYASSGVTLNQVVSSDKSLSLEIQAEEGVTYTTEFVGTRKGADLTGMPMMGADGKPIEGRFRYSKDVGQVLKTVTGNKASYTFQGDEIYVRARVTSSKLHPNPYAKGDYEQAWVQPAIGPAGPRNE